MIGELEVKESAKMESKTDRLFKLGRKRKRYPVPPGYHSIAYYRKGVYETKHVSPYTKTAGNLDADVFVMLQDWCSDNYLKGELCTDSVQYGHNRSCITNINLKKLLSAHLNLELKDTYGTNLFPFIKPGPMNAKIPPGLMEIAAVEFGLPQIEIVSPKLVICFGGSTFNAIRKAARLEKVKTVSGGIDQPFRYRNSMIWLQFHLAQQAQNTRNTGGIDRVREDWRKMKKRIGIT